MTRDVTVAPLRGGASNRIQKSLQFTTPFSFTYYHYLSTYIEYSLKLFFNFIMRFCAAFGCNNRSTRSKKTSVSFFRFPREKPYRQAWLKYARHISKLNDHHKLCSDNFSSNSRFKLISYSFALFWKKNR